MVAAYVPLPRLNFTVERGVVETVPMFIADAFFTDERSKVRFDLRFVKVVPFVPSSFIIELASPNFIVMVPFCDIKIDFVKILPPASTSIVTFVP